MRRWMASSLAALCLLSCAGCGTQLADAPLPLDELPSDYSLAQAKRDDCVVIEDQRVTYGQGLWDAFVEASSRGKPADVRLCHYYTLDEESCTPDHFAQLQDSYPVMYFQDLHYDGTSYTLRSFEDGQALELTYPYLMYYAGRAETPDATCSSYIRYVLTKDDSVTWEDIWAGMLSAQSDQAIDCYPVYVDLR